MDRPSRDPGDIVLPSSVAGALRAPTVTEATGGAGGGGAMGEVPVSSVTAFTPSDVTKCFGVAGRFPDGGAPVQDFCAPGVAASG